jgi:hypothetical protein
VPLNFENVRERIQLLSVAVPTRVEGENVLIEHALEQTDNGGVVMLSNDFSRSGGKLSSSQGERLSERAP